MNVSTELERIRVAAPSQAAAASCAAPETGRRHETRCSNCAMRALCMPTDLSDADLRRLDAMVGPTRLVRRGEVLYRTEDPFQNFFAVRSGSFKTVVMHRDGGEQVTGMHLPGDPLGLDGICNGHHASEAVALEDSSVCVIPFHIFESFCHDVRTMQRHFHRLLGSALVRDSNLLMLLGTMSAEQRVAAFLLNLSERFRIRGYSPTSFSLRMTREELGSYLGIKLETVSRMFSKFQKHGWLETQGKAIHLIDLDALERV
ncbi:Transcriptional regulatory protein btr [Pararobbsia alpina]|uniref:helix-turn-helix domain-containing protein n=1 Tax=Pararobbsia alpina TaxID=621374 RepID=UPI0039A557BE